VIGIAAVDQNWLMGLNRGMPWDRETSKYYGDFKWFKKVTKFDSSVLVMGKNTFCSLDCELLDGRDSLILNRDSKLPEKLEYDYNYSLIGGSKTFKKYLKFCTFFYLTVLPIQVDVSPYDDPIYFPLELLGQFFHEDHTKKLQNGAIVKIFFRGEYY